MVGKDGELCDIDVESLARVRLISSKKKQLEESANQVRHDIKVCFERLVDVLRGREKQLLRQVEAIHTQQLSLVQTNSELLPATSNLDADLSTEQELAKQLLNFGRIHISNSIAVNDSEPYKVEEYLEAGEDYISFDKSLKSETEEIDVTSVLRRKRDTNGNDNKILSINFNCVAETESIVSPEKAVKQFNNMTSETNINCENASNKNNCFTSDRILLPSKPQKERSFFENKNSNSLNYMTFRYHQSNFNKTSKTIDNCSIMKTRKKIKDGGVEHPIQIQQWLQQILAETETEPIMHEIGQFSKIPNTRLYTEFPVET